ncbi:unnamed protein product, partial [Coregonus sp. 'balchen']
VMKCKAAVAWEAGKPLSIVEVTPPKVHKVRIKVTAPSLRQKCYRSLRPGCVTRMPTLWDSSLSSWVMRAPGRMGEGVTKFKQGDTVIPLYVPQCGECKFCKKTNLCQKIWITMGRGLMPDNTSRFTCKGKQLFHFMGTSTFSEFTVVDEKAPLDKVCLLGCGISTSYGAALNTAKVEPGSTCAIFGMGAVGLAVIMGCKVDRVTRIIGMDINRDKFDKAKEFGATEFVNPKEHSKPIQEVLVVMTDGGFDYSCECIGDVGIMVRLVRGRRLWRRATKAGARASSSGWQVWDRRSPHVNSSWLLACVEGHSIRRSLSWMILMRNLDFSDSVESVPKLVTDYMNKKLKADEFVTHTLPFDQINEGFDLLHAGKRIRAILKF